MTAELVAQVIARWSDGATACESHGMALIDVEPSRLLEVARSLKLDFGFDLLLDVTAVDWPHRHPRFDVVYHFYSTQSFVRVRLRTTVSAAAPLVDSLTSLYNAARFPERECHEMYGIDFRGNDDLRPVLLYEGFSGHPLRKDYPKNLEQPLVRYRN